MLWVCCSGGPGLCTSPVQQPQLGAVTCPGNWELEFSEAAEVMANLLAKTSA